MSELNKWCGILEELTGVYPMNVKASLGSDGRAIVIFKIDEYQGKVIQSCRPWLPFERISAVDPISLTILVWYYVDVLFDARRKKDKPMLSVTKGPDSPDLFTPGTIIPALPEQVHAVAYGRYEDYRVAAVFTTKEKAEAYAIAQNKYWKEKGDRFFDELYYDDTLDLDPTT